MILTCLNRIIIHDSQNVELSIHIRAVQQKHYYRKRTKSARARRPRVGRRVTSRLGGLLRRVGIMQPTARHSRRRHWPHRDQCTAVRPRMRLDRRGRRRKSLSSIMRGRRHRRCRPLLCLLVCCGGARTRSHNVPPHTGGSEELCRDERTARRVAPCIAPRTLVLLTLRKAPS